MKVLHVTPYYHPSWAFGGIPRLVHGLCSKQNTQCTKISVLTTDVLTPKRRLDVPPIRSTDNIQIMTLPNLSHRWTQKQFFSPQINQQAQKLVVNSDIIHLHGYRNLLLLWAQQLAQSHNIPFLYTPNGCLQIHERRLFRKKVWDTLFPIPKNTNWVAVSEREREIMIDDFSIPPSKIQVIPNGIQEEEYTATTTKTIEHKNPIKIGYLGQLSPRKGVLDLLLAFEDLPQQIELHIAGSDMGSLSTIQNTIDQFSPAKQSQIFLHGILEGQSRIQFLQELDIFVYPSQDEIFGIAVFEALMCDCSVIVGNDSGCWEWVKKAQAGISFPPQDRKKLKEALLWSLDERNQDTIQKQKNLGYQFIQKHLRYSSIAQQYIELYHNIYRRHVRTKQ